MTRDELRIEFEACALGQGRGSHAVASRLAATVDLIEDDLLAEFNETIEAESFTVFETKGRHRIFGFDVSGRTLTNASEFLQLCIDEANDTAEIEDALKLRKRAMIYLLPDDLANRFTACANQTYARLQAIKNDPAKRRQELALMYDTQAFLKFAKTIETLPFDVLENFNAMRARTGVAVFKSDEDSSLGPKGDEFLLRMAIRDFFPEDSEGHLSEVRDASQFLKYCIKAMREDFQNEFDRPPPKMTKMANTEDEKTAAPVERPITPARRPLLTQMPGATFGKRTASA